jgi:hypothetical protein
VRAGPLTLLRAHTHTHTAHMHAARECCAAPHISHTCRTSLTSHVTPMSHMSHMSHVTGTCTRSWARTRSWWTSWLRSASSTSTPWCVARGACHTVCLANATLRACGARHTLRAVWRAAPGGRVSQALGSPHHPHTRPAHSPARARRCPTHAHARLPSHNIAACPRRQTCPRSRSGSCARSGSTWAMQCRQRRSCPAAAACCPPATELRHWQRLGEARLTPPAAAARCWSTRLCDRGVCGRAAPACSRGCRACTCVVLINACTCGRVCVCVKHRGRAAGPLRGPVLHACSTRVQVQCTCMGDALACRYNVPVWVTRLLACTSCVLLMISRMCAWLPCAPAVMEGGGTLAAVWGCGCHAGSVYMYVCCQAVATGSSRSTHNSNTTTARRHVDPPPAAKLMRHSLWLLPLVPCVAIPLHQCSARDALAIVVLWCGASQPEVCSWCCGVVRSSPGCYCCARAGCCCDAATLHHFMARSGRRGMRRNNKRLLLCQPGEAPAAV